MTKEEKEKEKAKWKKALERGIVSQEEYDAHMKYLEALPTIPS